MARANGKDPLDNDDGHKLKDLVLAGVMSRGSIMSLDYNGNEGMREALLAVLDEMEAPPTTAKRGPGRPRKGVDWAVERVRLASSLARLLQRLRELLPARWGGVAGCPGSSRFHSRFDARQHPALGG